MNLSYSKNIIIEKTENLILQRKDINKIFQISKIKKYNIPRIKFLKQETSSIENSNKIICRQINLNYYQTKTSKNNQFKLINKSFEKKSIQNKQKTVDFKEIKRKKEKNKTSGKYLEKNLKNKNNISLIRPIFADERDKAEKNIKNKEKQLNPINININNNFNTNSIFNNSIFKDFQKNSLFINNNFKFPFNNHIKFHLNRFEFINFSNNEDSFRNKETKFQVNSNNENKFNISGINFDNLKRKEKFNVTLVNSPSKETSSEKNKFVLVKGLKRKGRKSKNSQNLNIPSKHTKFSSDNMMRKIKNKIIESSRLLSNKVLSDEIKNLKNLYQFPYMEFKKIKGSFSQELNIKFNLWFYQIKIKDIFSMEISTKYSSLEKLSNKELIEYIFSEKNFNYFPKTQNLLNMSFHQYYHDIFLGEKKEWMNYFEIKSEENKYDINYLLKSLEEEDKNNNLNKIYIEKINKLAQDYEGFFLYKKMRNVDLGDKKNEFIKSFMNNTLETDYLKYLEQVKQIKDFYDKRKNPVDETKTITQEDINFTSKKSLTDDKQKDIKTEDILKNIIISIGDERPQFLEKKRNPDKKLN